MQISQQASKTVNEEAVAAQMLDAIPAVNRFICRQMRRHRKGLSLPQFRTLVRVDQHPSDSLSSLAEYLGSSASTASRIVTGLVTKGLITRGGSADDRRQLTIMITPRGRKVLDDAWSGAHASLEQELKALPPAAHRTLMEAMDVLKTIFGTPQECTDNPNTEPRTRQSPDKG